MQKKPSKKFVYLGLVIFIIILGYFGISLYLASQLVAPYPSRINVSPTLISSDYENVTIQGSDQTNLKGWLFHAQSNKLIILVHGIKQNRINDDYYSVLLAKELLDQGYNILMYDSRAHGESDGNQVTYGIKESQDIVNVVNFAKTKGFSSNHIGIIADSLGAISLLMAADRLQDIGALVVDSPAAHLEPVLTGVMQKGNHIPSFFNPAVFLLVKYVYHVDLDTIQPLTTVAAVPNRNFLFLHGAQDQLIPLSNSQEILKQANSASKLVIFPNAEHVETYKSDPQKYRDAIFPFLKAELAKIK